MPATGDISLYFHIPFCSKKCPYCHFYVLPDAEPSKKVFLKALEREWISYQPHLYNRRIASVYLGGGTPTLLGAVALQSILSWLDQLSLAPDCEITIEANPESLSADLLHALKDAGVNRLSIGVQSLDASLLSLLGREHTGLEAMRKIELAHKIGISNISIDLMYDIPQQTLSSWEKTLHSMQNLPITHLSLYNLTFEPQTAFFKNKSKLKPLLPSPEISLQLLTTAVESLEKIGLMRYEISAFSKPGFSSRHNIGYWTGRPFLGLGPSAFSYWDKKRLRNIAHLKNYAQALEEKRPCIDYEECLLFPDNLHELLAIHLRLLQGVCLESFQTAHGSLPSNTWEKLHKLIDKGWLWKEKNSLKLTQEGLLFYDSVAEEII